MTTTESTTGPIVRTTAGQLRGTTRDGVSSFLGIPYAAPPFGPRRFAAPEPAPRWDGVRAATAPGATAPQTGYAPPFDQLLPNPLVAGQDCLNLNVWTPDPGAAGLPVYVFVHGGSFVSGSGVVPTYDGTAFARDGVVCVTVNYRLGVEGFLHLDDGSPANRGLLDQVAALQWVQENIAAFGGDPGRVTVGGESAGAFSVGALLGMPVARGLFGQAVLQSGACSHAVGVDTARLVAGHLAERLGRAPTRDALADVPLPDLLAAQAAVTLASQVDRDPARWGEVVRNVMAFEPVVDGEVLPALPLDSVRAGSAAGVRLLAGTTTDEWRLFTVPTGVVDLVSEDLLALTAARFALPGTGLDAYRAGRPEGTPGDLLADVVTDWFFRVPVLRAAEAQAPSGAWVYDFAWPSTSFGGRLGACHALELPFVFDTLDRAPEHDALAGPDAPQALAEEVHAAWVRFVSDGDPGWPGYDHERRVTRVFGDPAGGPGVVEDPRGAQRRVWDGRR